MKYGLSVKLRDEFEPVNIHLTSNHNDATRLHVVLEAERKAKKDATEASTLLMLENGGASALGVPLLLDNGGSGVAVTAPERPSMPESTAAALMARYARPVNAPQKRAVCSFFERGKCNRGDMCPYLHREKATDLGEESSSVAKEPKLCGAKGIAARYYGDKE